MNWQQPRIPALLLMQALIAMTLVHGQSSSSAQSAANNHSAADTRTQSAVPQKDKKVLRIGVAQVKSIVAPALATDGWQQELVDDLAFLGAKGVILSADPNDRDATLEQAKQANCDYVILTTVTNYKSVGVGEKLSSVLGHGSLGGVGGSGQGRVEISAEAKVFQPDNPVMIFDSNNDFRQNDPIATAKGLLRTEARDVLLQLKRLQNNKENGAPAGSPSSSSSTTPKQ